MRLSALTNELKGQPLPTTPAGDSLDERIAECFVGEPPASSIIRVLIEDVKAANTLATVQLEHAKAKSLDPVTPAEEIAEARRMIDDAGWRQARTEIAGKRLAEVLDRVERAEQQAERDKRRAEVIERRDAMAAELREKYPRLVNELIDLLSRMQAVDGQARSMGLPTSEDLARHGAVQGNTPATSLVMCRLVDMERRYEPFAWLEGRGSASRVTSVASAAGGDIPAPPPTVSVPTARVKLTNQTLGQRMTYFDARNATHSIRPQEVVPDVLVLESQLPKLREYLTVEVLGPGEPLRRPAQ